MVMSITVNTWIGFLRSWERTFDPLYSQENQSQVCQGSSTRWVLLHRLLKGLDWRKYEITSDGATNAQAITTWQEIKKA